MNLFNTSLIGRLIGSLMPDGITKMMPPARPQIRRKTHMASRIDIRRVGLSIINGPSDGYKADIAGTLSRVDPKPASRHDRRRAIAKLFVQRTAPDFSAQIAREAKQARGRKARASA